MYARQLVGFSWCILLAAGSMVLAQSSDRPVNWKELPEPFHTKSSSNRPQVVPRPEGAKLNLPDGFHAEVIASGFERPRFMLLGPTGEVLVTDSGKRNEPTGSVTRLLPGKRTVLLEGLDRPYGLARYRGYLYVGEPTSIKRYPYQNQQITGEAEEVFSLAGFGKGHWTRTLLFDRQREKLYVTVGSSSNIGKGDPPVRAAINRINPDGSGHEIFATGLRNTVGLRWRPGTDELWGSVQERDGLGDDLVDDYLVHIKQGRFYGFPDAYSGPHKEPRHQETDQEKVDSSLYPDVQLGPCLGPGHPFLQRQPVPREISRRPLPGLSRLFQPIGASRIFHRLHPLPEGAPHLRPHRLPHGLDVGARSAGGLGTARGSAADDRRVAADLRGRGRHDLAGVLRTQELGA